MYLNKTNVLLLKKSTTQWRTYRVARAAHPGVWTHAYIPIHFKSAKKIRPNKLERRSPLPRVLLDPSGRPWRHPRPDAHCPSLPPAHRPGAPPLLQAPVVSPFRGFAPLPQRATAALRPSAPAPTLPARGYAAAAGRLSGAPASLPSWPRSPANPVSLLAHSPICRN